MKTIKNLSVKVTYNVGLGNVEVPDDVYEQLEETEEFSSEYGENYKALDWLLNNIHENDAYQHEFEVEINDNNFNEETNN